MAKFARVKRVSAVPAATEAELPQVKLIGTNNSGALRLTPYATFRDDAVAGGTAAGESAGAAAGATAGLAAAAPLADQAAASASAAALARDAAFVNAGVYADVAAGLAATALNGQFMVPSGGDYVRYRHDAGPLATEIARYPGAALLGLVDRRTAPLVRLPPGTGFRSAEVVAVSGGLAVVRGSRIDGDDLLAPGLSAGSVGSGSGGEDPEAAAAVDRRTAPLLRLPPGTGFRSAEVVAVSGGLAVVRGSRNDGADLLAPGLSAAAVAEIGQAADAVAAVDRRMAPLLRLPPGTGFRSAEAVAVASGLALVRGERPDGTEVRGGGRLSQRFLPLPPGLGWSSVSITEAGQVVGGTPVHVPRTGWTARRDAAGHRQLWWLGGTYQRQVTYGPEDKALLARGGTEVEFARDTVLGQHPVGRVRALPRQATATEARLRVVLVYGQSLALGHNGIGAQYQAWWTSPPAPGGVLMLTAGVNPIRDDQNVTLVAGSMGELVDAFSQSSTPPQNNNDNAALTAALGIWEAHDRASPVVCAALGRGGTAVAALGPASNAYANLLTTLDRIVDRAAVSFPGAAVEVVAVAWIHGEADATMSAADYTTARDALFASMTADIQTRTSQAAAPRYLVGQTTNVSAGLITGPAHAALSAGVAGTALFYGPQYPLGPYADVSHLEPRGYTDLGFAIAAAYRAWLRDGASPILRATSAVRTGTTITVQFAVPVGGLSLHPDVLDPGNLGLQFRDSTGSARILRARIASASTVQVDLSNVPTGSDPTLGIGDWETRVTGLARAAGSPLCDQARRFNPSSGAWMPNHAAMQALPVTTA